MDRIPHFIGGEHRAPAGDRWLDNVEPATGRVYSQVAAGDGRDVDRAVAAAGDAFPAWSRTPAEERSRILVEVARRIDRDVEPFARAESVDAGKPVTLARTVEIPRAVANLRFFATAVLHARSELHATDYTALNYTLRRPRGVAGVISPWNLPLYLFTWKIAPALACGNTVVAKPSELTPMTAHMLTEVCGDAGLPPGVLNVVHGAGLDAGAAIVAHPDVGTISFTGGTSTGGAIARVTAPMFKKVALEMGGKNPTIVFADADMDRVGAAAVRSAFQNQGQICLSGSRVFVERPAFDDFVDRFVAAACALSIGDPLDETTEQGALVSLAHLEKVRTYVDLARREGGRILCGGERPADLPDRCREGYFLEPVVVTGLAVTSRVNREEIFGPMVTITPFDREDEVVGYANDTPYGLSASVWTRDLTRAHRVAEAIDCGTVWLNCWLLRDLRVPFGGMKHSGVGREGGDEALRFFTEPKNVCVFLTESGGTQ